MSDKTVPFSHSGEDSYLKTKDPEQTLAMLEEYSKTLELRVVERTEALNKALALIEDEKNKLKTVVEAAPIGIGLIKDERLNWVNEEMLMMFRSERKQQYHTKNLIEFFPSEIEFINLFKKKYGKKFFS